MKQCSSCGSYFQEEVVRCPFDGQVLKRRADPLFGMLLGGKYRLYEKLAEGGMGSVYVAINIGVGRPVAIKVLYPDYARDEIIKKRFLREAKASNIVGHENIVKVFDLGETDGYLYIVMEFIEGDDLEYIIETDGKMGAAKAIHILKQCCDALGLAHSLGVIHRDIKPANIILTQRKNEHFFVKILDFGLAHLVTDPRLTEQWMTHGTPHYMSPEQGKAGKPAPSMDLYSLGCVAYEMLAGKPPFDGKSVGDIILKHINEPPPRLTGVPKPLERIVVRLLEKDPENRQGSAYEVLAELNAIGGMDVISHRPRVESARMQTLRQKVQSIAQPANPSGQSGQWGQYIEAASKSYSFDRSVRDSLIKMESMNKELDSLAIKSEDIIKQMETFQNDGMIRQHELGQNLGVFVQELSTRNARHLASAARLSDIEDRIKSAEDMLSGKPGGDDKKRDSFIAGIINRGKMSMELRKQKKKRTSEKSALMQNESEIKDLEMQIARIKMQMSDANTDMEQRMDEMNIELYKINKRKNHIEKELAGFARQFGEAPF